jgi:hypothetical protein
MDRGAGTVNQQEVPTHADAPPPPPHPIRILRRGQVQDRGTSAGTCSSTEQMASTAVNYGRATRRTANGTVKWVAGHRARPDYT